MDKMDFCLPLFGFLPSLIGMTCENIVWKAHLRVTEKLNIKYKLSFLFGCKYHMTSKLLYDCLGCTDTPRDRRICVRHSKGT